jgi:hypothetical protein
LANRSREDLEQLVLKLFKDLKDLKQQQKKAAGGWAAVIAPGHPAGSGCCSLFGHTGSFWVVG